MTREEAKSRLLNTAWLGTDEDRDKTEEAVGVLFDAVKVIEDIKAEIESYVSEEPHQLMSKTTVLEIIDKYRKEQEWTDKTKH